MDHQSAQSLVDRWVAQCQACVHMGAITALDELLITAPTEIPPATTQFYQGHIAVFRSAYEDAVRHFSAASDTAVQNGVSWLWSSSQVWCAYCHTIMGNYDVARALIATIDPAVGDDHMCATWSFVQALLTSYCDRLDLAQKAFEHARMLAVKCNARWLESRCCVNLASVYQHQGFLDRATRMLRRVGVLYQIEGGEAWRMIQVRNTAVNILRLRGNLAEALAEALPLPEPGDPVGQHFRGWLALSTALVAVDANDFGLAQQAWQRAADLLAPVHDNEFSSAELIWTRAWLRFRQGRMPEAYQDIQIALGMLDDQMDTDYLHGHAIAGIIALAHADLGSAGRILHQTCARFRGVGHMVGVASLLVHMAHYYEHTHYEDAARVALAEALTIMWIHGLHGLYYWEPDLMATLCVKAMQGDIWDAQASAIVRRLPVLPGRATMEPALDGQPEDTWADFAATLGARRLAATHWPAFVPLVHDPRPAVRRRAAQVLAAAQAPQAYAALQTLRADPDPIIRQWVSSQRPAAIAPPIAIYSFGRFQVLCHGLPLSVRRSGTRKALAVLGILLLAGERGFESRDLAVLLWPNHAEDDQRAALHSTISGLRQVLSAAAADQVQVVSIARRYHVRFQHGSVWWDWQELRVMAQDGVSHDHRPEVLSMHADAAFMDGLFDFLHEPLDLNPRMRMRWGEIYERVHDLVEQHAAEAAQWLRVAPPQ